MREGLFEAVSASRLVSMSSSSSSDAELVEAARAGDRRACEALFRRHHRKVAELAVRLLGHVDDVDDIVQDAFLEALQSLGRLKEPRAFAVWLCSIVATRVARRLRRRRLLERLMLVSASPLEMDSILSHACPPDAACELRGVYRILEALSPTARMALLLRRVEGLTNDEAAECMHVSVATVKRRLAEAEECLKGLREEAP